MSALFMLAAAGATLVVALAVWTLVFAAGERDVELRAGR